MKRYLLLMIIPALLAVSCGSKEGAAPESASPAVTGVIVEPVIEKEVQKYYRASGTVRAVDTAEISSKIMGEVREILAKTGRSISKGQVLIRLNAPDLIARRQAAEEEVEAAGQALEMDQSRMRRAEQTLKR